MQSDLHEITPEWVSIHLRARGLLVSGAVTSVEQRLLATTMLSSFFEVAIGYSGDSAGPRPASALLKLNEDRFYEAGRRELRFYDLAATESDLPVPRCFGGDEDTTTRRCAILLEDLRTTHAPPDSEWPAPPPAGQARAAVAALARVHAWGWGNARAENPEVWTREWVQRAALGLPDLADALGDELARWQRRAYERLLAALPSLLARSGPTTLLHGDAHHWNVLHPRDDPGGPATLLDWQLWRWGPAAFDLAYLIALHGQPDYRAEWEQPLLRHYAAELSRRGIDHPWNALWTDYRVGALINLLYPVLLHTKGVPDLVWRPHLERGFAAYEDLRCEELLR